MLALIAAISFLLSLLVGVTLGTVNLITLGLFFLALHLAIGPVIATRVHWGPRP
jgi:hypothetical protein